MSRLPFLASLALVACIVAAVPAAAESPRCAALANSALAEPDWYFQECLGGVAPLRTEIPAADAPDVPGDLFFLHNIRAAGQFASSVYTAPIPTYTFTLLGPNNLTIFAMDFNNAATTLYGINNTTRQIGTYSLTTGAFTPTATVSGIPAADNMSGLKFDPTESNPNMAFVSTTIALWRMDVTTGVATLVGPYTHAAPAIIDIAISNTGQVFGEDLNDNFFSINKTTGATTLLGPMGVLINFAQGMDVDNSDNTLYQFAYIGGGVNDLRRINMATGVSTLILTGPNGPEHEGSVRVPAVAPTVALVPAALSVDSTGNNVLEPNETNVRVAPSWRNPNATTINDVAGTLSNFTGPAGPAYLINDAAATYGNIAANATQSCADCYAVTITSATRPAAHWDATADETVTPAPAGTKNWTLHVGNTFAEVPTSNPFYRFIETLVHRGVTGGCTQTNYCPSSSTTREQMAVFVLISREGRTYSPPACVAGSEVFADVPASSPFCRWIEELSRRGVVAGCGGNNYCPGNPVTREQMTIFVLRTLDPTLNPPACAPPNLYNDVPETSPFCRWIEELTNRGVVTGCGGGNYCPSDAVTREQMGVFLAVTFALTLYGVN